MCTQLASAPNHVMFDATWRPVPWRDARCHGLLARLDNAQCMRVPPDAMLAAVQVVAVCARILQVLPAMSCASPHDGRPHGVMRARHGFLARLDNALCMQVCPRMPCLLLCTLLPCMHAKCKCSYPWHVRCHETAGPMARCVLAMASCQGWTLHCAFASPGCRAR